MRFAALTRSGHSHDRIVHELLDQRSRLALGTTNRERARAYFSVDTMVARYGALYDQLLEARAADQSS
jgi:hypothetical protein